MSELRQRRGEKEEGAVKKCTSCGAEMPADAMFCMKCGAKQDESSGTIATTAPDAGDGKKMSQDEMMNQISAMVDKMSKGPPPGLSHEAKKWKDALKEDPYSLEAMLNLGNAYAQDTHWAKCANVMIRGLKRVNEFKDADKAYDYLYLLATASLKTKKNKQALMILQDIKLPTDDPIIEFSILQCQVHCANGDSQKGIKAFHEAVKGQDFEQASQAWAMCLPYLRQVDAYDITKQAMDAIAQKEDDPEAAQKKLVVLEGMVELKESAKNSASDSQSWWKFMKYAAVFYIFFVVFVLYYLEGKSLSNLKKITK